MDEEADCFCMIGFESMTIAYAYRPNSSCLEKIFLPARISEADDLMQIAQLKC
jgi:hypothetical protein